LDLLDLGRYKENESELLELKWFDW